MWWSVCFDKSKFDRLHPKNRQLKQSIQFMLTFMLKMRVNESCVKNSHKILINRALTKVVFLFFPSLGKMLDRVALLFDKTMFSTCSLLIGPPCTILGASSFSFFFEMLIIDDVFEPPYIYFVLLLPYANVKNILPI